jgi:2-hydroxy-3-keto-5-methylthiopentenyl-1-phosphate phosphatase
MAPLIRHVLGNLIGDAEAAEIEIIANDVRFTTPEGSAQKHNGWEVVWRHPESGFGHDKSQSILPYRSIDPTPTLFFAGDGVSDLSAARHADLLFTKVGPSGSSDLKRYCEKEDIPHVVVRDFNKILDSVKLVVGGEKSYQQVIAEDKNN